MSRIEMMFSWWKWRRSLISRRVRRQNMEWSNGVMRLMATLRWEGMCKAELVGEVSHGAGRAGRGRGWDGPDDTICSFANHIEDLVVAADDEGGHAVVHGGWGGRVGGGRWGAMDKDGERREVQEVAQARSAA